MSSQNISQDDESLAQELVSSYEMIRSQVQRVIVGQDEVLEQLIIAMLAKGHCLLEGVPGLAKTLMIRSLSQAIDLRFSQDSIHPRFNACGHHRNRYYPGRQITGNRELVFEKGPIFSQIILADEINRTPPRLKLPSWRPCRSIR